MENTEIIEETEETSNVSCPACEMCQKKKERSQNEYNKLINRLNRIEGQVRGVRGMVENDAYCIDIIRQVSAISGALNSFNKELIASHIETCVSEGIKNGNKEIVDELISTIHKLMR